MENDEMKKRIEALEQEKNMLAKKLQSSEQMLKIVRELTKQQMAIIEVLYKAVIGLNNISEHEKGLLEEMIKKNQYGNSGTGSKNGDS